jgi:hypothetical protein
LKLPGGYADVQIMRFGYWGIKERQYHMKKEVVRLPQKKYTNSLFIEIKRFDILGIEFSSKTTKIREGL